jgi:NADPH:quinone reductase-like Zn-dependent oxidoreductase
MVGAPHSPSMIELLGGLLKPLMLSLFVSQKLSFFIAKPNKEDLTMIGELISSGKVTPVIDRWYRLSEVPEAIRYLEEGHARGKVIIVVE